MITPKRYQTCLCLLLLVFGSARSFGQCPGTAAGPKTAGTFTNNTSVGALAWSNPANAQVQDNVYSSAGQLLGVLSSVQTNYLQTSNFNFSVPSTASICGIQVDVWRNAAGLIIGSSVVDKNVYIVKNGTVSGTNHASASAWTGANSMVTYGGNSDLWGLTWTPTDINQSNFGVVMSTNLNAGLAGVFLTANIDYVRVTVYYDNSSIALPIINIAEFKGTAEQDKVKLEWSTTSEVDNSYFAVEKMDLNYNWYGIATVKGNGSSAPVRAYQAYDRHVQDMNYYRLREVSTDNSQTYSNIIAVKGTDAGKNLSVYPVPASGSLSLSLDDQIESIEVYNGLRLVMTAQPSGEDTQSIDISALPEGMYTLKVLSHDKQYVKKFCKQ